MPWKDGPLSQQRVPVEIRRAARIAYDAWELRHLTWWGQREEIGMPRLRRNEASESNKRALNLLRRHLTEEQLESLGEHGYFNVTGRMKRYGRWQRHLFQIHQHCVLYEVEPTGRRHFCMVALEPGMPDWDWMLVAKMMIESNLRRFYDTAKRRAFQPVDRYDA